MRVVQVIPSVDEADVVELFESATNVGVTTGTTFGSNPILYVSSVADILVMLIDFTIEDVEVGTV